MKKLLREFMTLNKEQRDISKNPDKYSIFNAEHFDLSKKPINEGWIKISGEHFVHTEKYINLKKERVSSNLNLPALKKRVRDGYSKPEDALFELSVFEERIKAAKLEIINIDEETNACQHEFKPYDANYSFDLFNNTVYRWIFKCPLCGKEKTETTNRKENAPSGFEKINVKNYSSLY